MKGYIQGVMFVGLIVIIGFAIYGIIVGLIQNRTERPLASTALRFWLTFALMGCTALLGGLVQYSGIICRKNLTTEQQVFVAQNKQYQDFDGSDFSRLNDLLDTYAGIDMEYYQRYYPTILSWRTAEYARHIDSSLSLEQTQLIVIQLMHQRREYALEKCLIFCP